MERGGDWTEHESLCLGECGGGDMGMVGSGTCYRDLFSRCGVRAGLVDAVAKHQNPHRLTKENFSKPHKSRYLKRRQKTAALGAVFGTLSTRA